MIQIKNLINKIWPILIAVFLAIFINIITIDIPAWINSIKWPGLIIFVILSIIYSFRNDKRDSNKTIQELEKEFEFYLKNCVKNYEERSINLKFNPQQNIPDLFIEPKGTIKESNSINSQDASVIPIYPYIYGRINNSKPCIIIADFGMGKTWLLETTLYRLAKEQLSKTNGERIIPIKINLRDYRYNSFNTMDNCIERLFKNTMSLHIGKPSYKKFKKNILTLLYSGRFLMLLDALDEMILDIKEEFDKIIAELSKYNQIRNRSNFIITCRKTFLRDNTQEKILLDRGFEIVSLSPWEISDVRKYLNKAYTLGIIKTPPDEGLAILESTYDMKDLSSRAILTAMLVSQWDNFLKQKSVNLISLYENCVEKWLLDWQTEKAWHISKNELQEFMNELAFLMFKLNTLEISPKELDKYFSNKYRKYGIRKASSIAESISRDIRTNSLLLRINEKYVFCHLSFWEFLVARKLVKSINFCSFKDLQIPNRMERYSSIMNHFVIPILKTRL